MQYCTHRTSYTKFMVLILYNLCENLKLEADDNFPFHQTVKIRLWTPLEIRKHRVIILCKLHGSVKVKPGRSAVFEKTSGFCVATSGLGILKSVLNRVLNYCMLFDFFFQFLFLYFTLLCYILSLQESSGETQLFRNPHSALTD